MAESAGCLGGFWSVATEAVMFTQTPEGSEGGQPSRAAGRARVSGDRGTASRVGREGGAAWWLCSAAWTPAGGQDGHRNLEMWGKVEAGGVSFSRKKGVRPETAWAPGEGARGQSRAPTFRAGGRLRGERLSPEVKRRKPCPPRPCRGRSHAPRAGAWPLGSAPGRWLLTWTRAVGAVERRPQREGVGNRA